MDSSRKFTLCFSNYSESKALKKFRLIAYTVIAIISLASIAQCQGLIGFDRGSFGSVVLSQKQSLGTDLQLELSIGSYENEPIINYSSGSVFAQIGKSVGRLDVLTDKGLFPCTAFIVSTKYILTNYHCSLGLLNDERIGATRIDATQFVAGYLQTGIEAESKKYTVIPTPKEYSKRLDYAVLEVIGDPSQEYGQLKLANITPNDGDPFWIIGHPMGEGQRISREKCKANNPALSGDKLLHTCDTLPGNSGSPVIDAGLQQVVALHHAGSQKDSVNYAILMSEILKNSKVLKAYKAPKVLPVETKETISCDALYNAAANAKACYAYDVYIDKCSAHTLAPMARGYVKEFCKQTLIKKDNNLSEPVKMKEQTCPEDIKKCKPKFLCRMATEKTNSKTVWETSVTLQKYVNEAKRRGISCGTGKKTCLKSPRECMKENLCFLATKTLNNIKTWETNVNFLAHVDYAKSQNFTCDVKKNNFTNKITKKEKCTDNPKHCDNKEICIRATKLLNSSKIWENRDTVVKYATEAKSRFLNCGVYEKFNLAIPKFTSYGKSSSKYNDEIRSTIVSNLLKSDFFNKPIQGKLYNRSFKMPVEFSKWKNLKTDFLIMGSVEISKDELIFELRLFDILKEKPIGEVTQFVTPKDNSNNINLLSFHALESIKRQFSVYLNSSSRRDTIKMIQEKLSKAGCDIDLANGVIGTKTRAALKEITQKLEMDYSYSLATTPSYMFNLLKVINRTDISKYWCSSNSVELAVDEKSSYDTALELLNDDKFELAINEFDKLINAFPNGPLIVAAHYSKGDAYTGIKNWKLALKNYLKSYELDPSGKSAAKALKASYQTALMSLNENNFELAIIQFDSLIDVIPNGPLLTAAHYSKGDAFSELEDWKSAGKSYLESFRLEPEGKHAAKALMNVGMSLGKMQKINEACNILSRVEIRFPRNQIVEEAQYEMQILGCS